MSADALRGPALRSAANANAGPASGAAGGAATTAGGDLAGALRTGETTLPRLLRARAEAHPDRLALREKEHGIWKRYTWRYYHERACLVAQGLLSLGIRPGDRIAVAGENTPEWFYADLGAQMIGAVVVGIYPTNPWPELQYIVAHCGARAVFTGDQEQTDKVYDAIANGNGLPAVEAVICTDMKGLARYGQKTLMSFEGLCELGARLRETEPGADARLEEMIDRASPDDTCIIVYTSGTTGPPKGAMLSHRNFVVSASGYAEAVGMTGHAFRAVSYLPLCHFAERCYTAVMQLVLDGEVSFAESIDTVAGNIREIAPTFFIGVPRIYEKLKQNFTFRLGETGRFRQALVRRMMALGRGLSDRKQAANGRSSAADRLLFLVLYWALFRNVQRYLGLDRSRHRLCAGASVSPETLRFFDIVGLPTSQGYGLTESGGVVFVQDDAHRRLGGCGLPVRGAEWQKAADGEILIRGATVFKGYFDDPKGTAETMTPDGWLKSGDIVDILDNGELTVVDRKKAIIITAGGKNIAPSEIENALKDSDYVKEAIVVGEARKFVGALIQVDYDNVGRWAEARDLAYTNYRSLATLPEVRDLVQGIVDEVNAHLARVANVRRFVVLDKELDHDDGELTATQKVRRAMIEKKFGRELAVIYGEEAAA